MCYEKEKYGILVGHIETSSDISHPLFLRFEKEFGQVFKLNSYVYYLINDVDEYTAIVIDDIDNLPNISSGHNLYIRSDKQYHYDEDWDLIKRKKNFFKKESLYLFNVNEAKDCSIFPLSKLSKIVYQLILSIKRLEAAKPKDLQSTVSKIDEIESYIDSLNISDIINTYEVGSWGMYNRVVDKDNYYCYGNYKRIKTDDGYIKSLIPLEDNTDYYNTDVQGDDEQDFSETNEIEAEENKAKALQRYNRKEHVAYFLNQYFRELEQESFSLRTKKMAITDIFSVAIGIGYFFHRDAKEFIKQYNSGKVIINLTKLDLNHINRLITAEEYG